MNLKQIWEIIKANWYWVIAALGVFAVFYLILVYKESQKIAAKIMESEKQ